MKLMKEKINSLRIKSLKQANKQIQTVVVS